MNLLDVYEGRLTWADYLRRQSPLAQLLPGAASLKLALSEPAYQTALTSGLGGTRLDNGNTRELELDSHSAQLNADFTPLLERILPLMGEPGRVFLQRALADMNSWRRAGATLVPMSVNVSPSQLRRGKLDTIIATLLKAQGISADMLQLEMTERVMFDGGESRHGESSKDSMSRLRDLGVRIAIDDFGTGYSSLSYLKTWRVDALKVDRSFIRDLVTDSSDLAIVNAIVAMARHLNIEVIAEGIESYQQVETLLTLGCKLGQGFLFAKPMPAAECLPWLKSDDPKRAAADDEEMLVLTA